jgi:hypothetical protein
MLTVTIAAPKISFATFAMISSSAINTLLASTLGHEQFQTRLANRNFDYHQIGGADRAEISPSYRRLCTRLYRSAPLEPG